MLFGDEIENTGFGIGARFSKRGRKRDGQFGKMQFTKANTSPSFVGTYMEPHAKQLLIENLSKNLADSDEYPALMVMHQRCVSMLGHLWAAQKGEKPTGSATVGSSEAVHLGGLAMKRRWQEKRRAEGKDASNPNIIMGSNAQVALEKFARYFDVEARILPVSEASNFRLDPGLMRENVDENTIGVFVILGSTYTGHYEPVEEIAGILDEYERETGIDIPIHVDAASGGFVAPFTHASAGGHKWFVLCSFPFSLSLSRCPFPSKYNAHHVPGTSSSLASSPSTPRATNSALSTRASAGSSGATRPSCPSI
jgi:glutamate decarboxylase